MTIHTCLQRFVLTGLLFGICCLCQVSAADTTRSLKADIVQASLFKNGKAFLVLETAIPGPGEYEVTDLPKPFHGTFWLIPEPSSLALKDVVWENDTVDVRRPARNLHDLLLANAGAEIEIQLKGGEWLKGIVIPFEERSVVDLKPTPTKPAAEGEGRDDGDRKATGSGLVRVRTGAGERVILAENVTGFRRTEGPVGSMTTGEELSRNLRFTAGSGGKIRILALSEGLTWAPSYLVESTASDEAILHCKAAVVNTLRDINGARIQFVTGFPNLRMDGIEDPLAPDCDLLSFLSKASDLTGVVPPRRTEGLENNYVIFDEEASEIVETQKEGSRQDLFVFNGELSRLEKGQRAYVPLFEVRVPCRDVYFWDVSPTNKLLTNLEPDSVWHTLKLTNTGKWPWTTAPAVTLQGDTLLGQDILAFTPPGASNYLRVTKALDIMVREEEREMEGRLLSTATDKDGDTTNWSVVTEVSEMRVFNRKDKPVTLVVRKALKGEVLETVPKVDAQTTSAGFSDYTFQELIQQSEKKIVMSAHAVFNDGLNPRNTLRWEVRLEPGEKKTLKVRYRMLVAR
ncbi:MAG: hypothetical protein KA419_02320 [Acidobacteria bacterium]|nr:hypothetical protein [Acidobacteriota bacterium]